ncbi:SH3 domain-containing protein [Gracilibacillus caseinilyticus]|uniref:SH3 domain-containing protein n=1 Tax=Gracilibacillus caseinilyticus TaxID=2932256 RepID=A0ABY4F0U4_9BACI|nr:SH3 domain-containing protein [Gracilibacillus caseinilyticus]UOQ50289.1 SH3 domain-containing protein [Gracilibacillus caseinilyticus]
MKQFMSKLLVVSMVFVMLPTYGPISLSASGESQSNFYEWNITQPFVIQKDDKTLGELHDGATVYLEQGEEGTYLLKWGEQSIELSQQELEAYLPFEDSIQEEVAEEETEQAEIPADTVLYLGENLKEEVGIIDQSAIFHVVTETEDYVEVEIGHASFYISASAVQPEESSSDQTDDNQSNLESDQSSTNDQTDEQSDQESDSSDDQPNINDQENADATENEAEKNKEEPEEEPEEEVTKESIDKQQIKKSITSASITTTRAFTSSDQYFEVTEPNLTVYDNSTGKLVPIGKLMEGDVFKLIRTVGNWHEVQFGEKMGYVYKPATKPADKSAEKNWTSSKDHSKEARALENLTVYDNSSGSLVAFAQIYKNESFRYIDQQGNWARIEIGGRMGYIYVPAMAKGFTDDTEYFEVLVDYQSVYDNSSGSLVKTGVLRQGEVYKLERVLGNWLVILVAGERRYVLKETTKPAERSAEKNWYSPSGYKSDKRIAFDRLTIYDNTSGSLVPFGYIEQGKEFNYVSHTGNWIVIDYGGRKGYVYAPATYRAFNDSDKYFEVLKDNLTVYDNSSGSLKAVGKLPEGAVLERTGDYGNWHRIQYGDKYAFVWKFDTKPSSKPPKLAGNPSYNKDKLILSQSTPVYDNSTGELIPFAYLPKDELYPYIRMVGNWYEIEYGGRIGYIYYTAVENKRQFAETNYSIDYQDMLDIQMTKTPKVDGAGRFIASRELVSYYANSNNFDRQSQEYLQFLILSEPANLDADEINAKVLKGKGSLEGTAEAFIEAGEKYNVNEVYLIAHALHETANGTSTLASGVTVNGKKTYNMYGIEAYDGCAVSCGSQHAYDEGWFTPEAAVIGGAEFIADDWINDGQDTLYKMRWNPESPGYPQYATHVSWALSQTSRIQQIYDMLETYILKFDVPIYKNQPGSTSKPSGADQYYVNTASKGSLAETTANLNLRSGPSTSFSKVRMLSNGEQVEIMGSNGGWYKVVAGSDIGWVSGDYLKFKQQLRVVDGITALNVRSSSSTKGSVLGQLKAGQFVTGVVDQSGKFVKENGWYKIIYKEGFGWVSGTYIRE